jgi:hypothetical protein
VRPSDRNDNIWTAEELLRHLCEQVREYINNTSGEIALPERYWAALASLLEFTTGPTPTLEAHKPEDIGGGWGKVAERFLYIDHDGGCDCCECLAEAERSRRRRREMQ